MDFISVIVMAVTAALSGMQSQSPLIRVRADAPRLAQAFKVESDEKQAPENVEKDKKKADKPAEIKSEKDLWSEPARAEKGDKKKDEDDAVIEEIDPDEIEDIGDEGDKTDASGENDRTGLGGWGADVERDSWGDEERIENAESLIDSGSADTSKKEPQRRAADGGTAARKAAEVGEQVGASADAGTRTEEDRGQETAIAEEIVTSQEIRLPSGSVADLAALWERRRIHLAQRDFELARQDLADFLELKDELSIRNMYVHATVLLRQAEQARLAEDEKLAQELVAAAVETAPDLPAAYLSRAALWFSEDPLGVGRYAGAVVESVERSLAEPFSANRLKVNVVAGLLLGLLLTAAIYVLIQFLRYLRLFFHDFHHLFPNGVARLQTGLLAILVILIPIIFRTGLVSVLLLWALIAWLYQQRTERVLTLLAVGLLAVTPLVIGWLTSMMSLPMSITADVVAVDKEAAPGSSLTRLKTYLEENPDDKVVLAALGGYYKRIGELDLAEQYLGRAIEAQPSSAVLHNNLGNVMFLKKDMQAAVRHYDRATKERPDLAQPYYNLSRAYYAMMDHDKGKEHFSDANRLDAELVRKLRKRSKSGRARDAVADLALPGEWLSTRRDLQNGHRQEEVTNHVWANLGGTGNASAFPFIGIGVAVLFALMLLLRKKIYLSAACVRCGRPACRRCNSELPDDSMCGQCFHAFRHKDAVDAKSRISKEIQIRHYRRRKEQLARFITFVLPGVGQLIKDRTLRGGLFLAVFCCVAVQILTLDGIMANPHSLGDGIDWLKLIPLLVLFLGFYAWAILDAFRTEL